MIRDLLNQIDDEMSFNEVFDYIRKGKREFYVQVEGEDTPRYLRFKDTNSIYKALEMSQVKFMHE